MHKRSLIYMISDWAHVDLHLPDWNYHKRGAIIWIEIWNSSKMFIYSSTDRKDFGNCHLEIGNHFQTMIFEGRNLLREKNLFQQKYLKIGNVFLHVYIWWSKHSSRRRYLKIIIRQMHFDTERIILDKDICKQINRLDGRI